MCDDEQLTQTRNQSEVFVALLSHVSFRSFTVAPVLNTQVQLCTSMLACHITSATLSTGAWLRNEMLAVINSSIFTAHMKFSALTGT